MSSEAVLAKAVRLLGEGRVEPTDGDNVFEVVGDSETYWPVVVSPSRQFCPCPAVAGCSHLEAAQGWVQMHTVGMEEYGDAQDAALFDRKAALGLSAPVPE